MPGQPKDRPAIQLSELNPDRHRYRESIERERESEGYDIYKINLDDSIPILSLYLPIC